MPGPLAELRQKTLKSLSGARTESWTGFGYLPSLEPERPPRDFLESSDATLSALRDHEKGVLKLHTPSRGEHEKGTRKFLTPGGEQSLVVISESGFYRLAFRSNKEAARRFTDWVVEEVLPTLRQTGKYAVSQEDLA